MDTPVSYSKFIPRVQNTISDEKDIHGTAEFKTWVVRFKILHEYHESKNKLKVRFQTKEDAFQAIISKKLKDNTEIFVSLNKLAVEMPKTHDYEKQKSGYVRNVQKNTQDVVFCEMSICDIRKARRAEFLKLWKSELFGRALEEANVIFAKIRECEQEIDDMQQQEKDELEQQEKDELEQQESMRKALRKKTVRIFTFSDIEVVKDPLSP